MLKLRFLIRKNHLTAEKVREYADRANLTLMQAKRELAYETKPVLQYWFEDDWNAHWVDIPTVVEYIDEEK